MRVPRFMVALAVLPLALSLTSTAQAGPFGYDLVPIGVDTLPGGSVTAEIVSYDAVTKRMAVIDSGGNAVHIVSLTTPAAPADVASISMAPYGGTVNSVVGAGGYFAAAVENTNFQLNGRVVIIDAATATVVADVTVGVLPDAITITPDGQRLVVSNEGQPACVGNAYVDPEGSVSVITKPGGGWSALVQANVAQASFTSFNASIATLRDAGVRIFGPGSSVAQDVEPEYGTATNTTAWVSLQEANAIATVDLATATVTAITPLGTKDHLLPGYALDSSDRDNGSGGPAINIANRKVQGMYQPDGVATFDSAGTQYLLTANEGDSRNYGSCMNEEIRVNAATIALPLTAADKDNAVLGRMQVSNRLPDGTIVGTAGSPMTVVNAFGARSFSVRNATTGALVWDSGDAFERIIATDNPSFFNTDFDAGTLANFDLRSDNKDPNPSRSSSAMCVPIGALRLSGSSARTA